MAIAVAAGTIGALGGVAFAWALSLAEEGRRRAEREQAARALRHLEDAGRHNESVLASTTEGIITVDLDGRCTSINPTGAALLGYRVDELLGADKHTVIHHHHADGSVDPADTCRIRLAVWSRQRCHHEDDVFWRKNGSRMPVEYSVAPLLVDGAITGSVVSFSDIGARRGLDEQAERDAAELRTAIRSGELVLHYQPKLDVGTGELCGVEALVRWQHPTRGLIYPDAFIPLAERSGVMVALTAFVLNQAVRQHIAWRADGLTVSVAVNLSVDSLAAPGFPDWLEALCRRHGVATAALELEVTETGVMHDPNAAIAVLQRLVEAGFAVAVDDFGTGFSSLAYLRLLPASVVKIDKSFITYLPDSEADAQIVRGTIELVHGLGKRVVAEGVETPEALEFLRQAGCDIGQGYHWSKALTAADLLTWAEAHRRRPIVLSAG